VIHEWNNKVWSGLAASADRLPHALLIHGPGGTGKRALAEHFAQYILCEAVPAAQRPCGRCEACRWFAAGNHPDLRWLEPEAIARRPDEEPEEGRTARTAKPSLEIKVEQVRALADFLNIGSHRGGRRIALIHPAEDMNLHAANSLLKSLEEPPPGAVFVLVSHRPARLLPTIRSRCVSLPVGLPRRDVAEAWLREQKVPDASRWLAFAGGSPLRALEYASGPRGELTSRLLKALQAGELQAGSISEREEIDALTEVLQKVALDQAFASAGVEPKYATTGAERPAPERIREWLAFARVMGRNRALARHPLNPKLFAAEMIAAMPAPRRRG